VYRTEYLIEAACLALFMVSACSFGVVLEYPSSPVHQAIADPLIRRVLMGTAMGVTAAGIIYSPLGRRSGAHMNPAVTLTYLTLGKIAPRDAAGYVSGQFLGGIAGVAVSSAAWGTALSEAHVNYVATLPGNFGIQAAFAAEAAISFALMATVLAVSNHQRLNVYTPLFAGGLVALYITLEAPISGMSMNPARTLGSALPADALAPLWIYFTAPPLGMLAAAALYKTLPGVRRVYCAKLFHDSVSPCIFRCEYHDLMED
jgi:aquaporin Z